MNTHVLRLAPGDDLRGALEAAFADLARAQGLGAASVVTGIGSLSQAVLRYAGEPGGTALAGPLELIMLAGTLSVDGAHLHAGVAGADGRLLLGGHVMPGCTVRTMAEVVLALLPGWAFGRAMDPATGYKELVAKPLGTPEPPGSAKSPG